MDTPTSPLVRFGVFELDLRAGELRRSGRRVALQPQPLEILRALMERPGEVVTREELRHRLWGNGAYVDFDRSLNKAIVKLRDALGDDADSPRYIETLPRHGYRFIPLPQVHAHVDAGLAATGAVAVPDPEATSGASTAVPVSAASGVTPAPAPPSHHGSTALPEVALAQRKPLPSGQEPADREITSSTAATTAPVWRPRLPVLVLIAALAIAALLTSAYAVWRARSGPSVTRVRLEAPSQSAVAANVAPASEAAFSPPPHSIAVLPFVNISGDKEQEYFSDGLTEELLNSLSRIDGLQVVGRTSSFYFKGKDVDLGTVGHRLNVAAVLEGSVRRSAHTVRVTARLTSAVTGLNLWSATYDRDIGDILRLQSEIANAVGAALKVKLLGNAAGRVELGGTRNPAAFDAYLRASRIYWSAGPTKEAVAGFTEAVAQDPDYALAHVALSIALMSIGQFDAGLGRKTLEAAQAEALKAAQLAPELADSHLALAYVAVMSLDFARAEREFERAMALAPGSERILRGYSGFATGVGRVDSGIDAARRAVELNPLNEQSYASLAEALEVARRYDEAMVAFNEAIALAPDARPLHVELGNVYYELGSFERSRSECEMGRELFPAQICLAATYEKLGRHRDAQAELAKLRASGGDAGAFFYAEIYAQWGRSAEALKWLDTAMRLRSPELSLLREEHKLDPLRKESRFQAIERALKFPN